MCPEHCFVFEVCIYSHLKQCLSRLPLMLMVVMQKTLGGGSCTQVWLCYSLHQDINVFYLQRGMCIFFHQKTKRNQVWVSSLVLVRNFQVEFQQTNEVGANRMSFEKQIFHCKKMQSSSILLRIVQSISLKYYGQCLILFMFSNTQNLLFHQKSKNIINSPVPKSVSKWCALSFWSIAISFDLNFL